VLLSERRARLAGHDYMFGQQILDTVRTETTAAGGRKKHLTAALGRFPYPRLENRHGGLGERRASFFATLTYAADVRPPTQNYVGSL
jgi:hypothetical protein